MIINFLWIGDQLGKLEQLTLCSFLQNKHTPYLWTYNINCKGVPEGVVVKDASTIINREKIFYYTGGGDCRKGSCGGFSDIFRYHLLRQQGGWYCDMDVTCLKSFEEIDNVPYLFRPHRNCGAVGNIMKCPANSEFLDHCIIETEKQVTADNKAWVLPVQILKQNIDKFNLSKYIAPVDWFGRDDITEIQKYVDIGSGFNRQILPRYAIHWCNEAISTGQWNISIKRDFNTPVPQHYIIIYLKNTG